jgi:5-methylcytosine-specific restriction endonuclease McrA
MEDASVRAVDLYRLACEWSHGLPVGQKWRDVLLRLLVERDGSNCHLCDAPVLMHLASGVKGDPSGLGPSVDHVIPRSKGGSDDPGNMRLAHWKCNRERSARSVADYRYKLDALLSEAMAA